MPTRSDFETAAELFSTAASLIGDLAASAHGADASRILRGGSLGANVPQRIRAAAASADLCQQQVVDAADLCRERAAVIADYERRLTMYDYAHHHFETASRVYASNHAAWFLDESGTISHPGEAPAPPRKPVAPPSWADVRRP